MYGNDKERYENCMIYANTMMFMVNIVEKRFGKNSEVYRQYVKQGIESCKMAIEYKDKWKEDSTCILNIAA